MSERHVTDQLPLWVEGDLDAQSFIAIEAHLAGCEACRAEAEAFRESQAWLKSDAPPPFTVEDREQLRREVLARVQSTTPLRVHNSRWGFAVIAMAAAASIFILLARPRHGATEEPVPPPRGPAQAPLVPAPAIVSVPRTLQPVHRHVRISKPDPESAGPGAARIELQTSNPQIRIIWLARASAPEGSPNPI